ncbi:MAG: hypothetical protein LR008_03460 [Candidatus Pacebacteria bacterium]|nr:hypothetical protein [Candidatus Paceibacterota bacterium]
MYVVFYGSDRGGVKDKATQYIEKNMPADGTLTTLEEGYFEEGQVTDSLGATSLFGGSEWFVFDNPSSNTDFADEVKSSLFEMAESVNTFVILESALLAPDKKIYNKYASETEEFKVDKSERFNAFSMAEALASKDKRRLWVLLQEAKLEGLREEEVVGMLWWQLKSLKLAALTKTADEAGMKDFPYNKAKRALAKFQAGEVDKLSQSLLELYHEGHAGVRDMDSSLEQWVLGV